MCLAIALTATWPVKAQSRGVLVSRRPNSASQNNPNIEILQTIARRMDLRLELVRVPFKRALIMMKNGYLDVMAGLLKSPDREAYIFYIQPPYKTRSDTVFFVPKGQAGLIGSYEDLFSLKTGLTSGAKYFPQFDQDTRIVKEVVADGETSFRKMLAGRIQTVISSEADGIELTHKMGIASQVEMAAFRFKKKKNVYIGLSRTSKIRERLPGLELTIKSMIESGEILRIFQNYYISRKLPVPAF